MTRDEWKTKLEEIGSAALERAAKEEEEARDRGHSSPNASGLATFDYVLTHLARLPGIG